MLAIGAGAALLELLAGLFLGAFPLTGRAEAFGILLFRPWVVLLLALSVSGRGWRFRLGALAAFLLVAGFAEAACMHRLGNPDPWPETLRGWAGGAAVALAADLALSVARRRGRWWATGATLLLAGLLALPPVRSGYERVVAGAEPAGPAAHRPRVLLMTALPLIWGEGGAFDPGSRPAAIYPALQREFDVQPVDTLDRQSLAGAGLLLLVQPRWLAPHEFVALDAWVRGGGKALILTDPRLNWHSDLPLGDVRRPPPSGLLSPLLGHWGLKMQPGNRWEGGGLLPRGRRLVTEFSGRLASERPNCRTLRLWLADCRIGAGRALVLADADLVRDDLWVGQGDTGSARHRRLSDNPLVVADLLDRLAGLERARVLGDARWWNRSRRQSEALLPPLGVLAGLALAAAAAALLLRRIAKPHTYPQA